MNSKRKKQHNFVSCKTVHITDIKIQAVRHGAAGCVSIIIANSQSKTKPEHSLYNASLFFRGMLSTNSKFRILWITKK